MTQTPIIHQISSSSGGHADGVHNTSEGKENNNVLGSDNHIALYLYILLNNTQVP